MTHEVDPSRSGRSDAIIVAVAARYAWIVDGS